MLRATVPRDRAPKASSVLVKGQVMILGDDRARTARRRNACAHPLSIEILWLLDGDVRSARDMADEFGQGVPNVAYHVRVLADLGALRPVSTSQRRGAIEHFSTATVRITITQEAIR